MEFDLLGSLTPQNPSLDPGHTSAGPTSPRCSRRGCDRAAQWQLLWNNPRVHTPERRKMWLACDEHRVYLGEFLEQRGFLKSAEPFDAAEGRR